MKSVRKRNCRQPLPISPIAHPKPISFNLGPILAQLGPLSTSIYWPKPRPKAIAQTKAQCNGPFSLFLFFFSSSPTTIPCCQPMLLLQVLTQLQLAFQVPMHQLSAASSVHTSSSQVYHVNSCCLHCPKPSMLPFMFLHPCTQPFGSVKATNEDEERAGHSE